MGLLLARAGAQDPLKVLPQDYRLVLDNETVRVIRAAYQPHQKLAAHDHPHHPTVYVYLNDSGPVRFSHVEQPAFTRERPLVKAGTFGVSPGRIETHTAENLGNKPCEFLRIELKQVPLRFQANDFRSVKPFNLELRGTTSEFWTKAFRIERMITGDSKPIEIQDPNHPSLIVDLTANGSVYWREAHQPVLIKPPSHVLRIVFP